MKGKQKIVIKMEKEEAEADHVQGGADELKKKHDKWLVRLAAVEEREKVLKQRRKEKNYPKIWWETPVEELTHEEARQRDALFMDLHRKILNAVKGKTIGASSSDRANSSNPMGTNDCGRAPSTSPTMEEHKEGYADA